MLKVIIVEDEDIIRKGLVYTIDWLSMDCVVVGDAPNGEEGLNKIIELCPDVVITDIKMPKLDGIEMLRQALEYVNFKSIILTSYAEFEYARKAIELGTYNYLLKPVDEVKICQLMKELNTEINNKRKAEFVIRNTNEAACKLNINYYMQLDNTHNKFVAKAIQRIKEDYAEKISIESISEDLGVSTSYLSRKFKDITNHTFLDLLNMYRVQQAIKLLDDGSYRIYEVSDLTGFSDYKHFCTVFKRYTMMAPTEFIKKLQYHTIEGR